MKRLLALAAFLVGMLAIGSDEALAAPCTPTPLFRDNMFLTAQLVNPPLVTGAVVATGCHIGVYVGPGVTSTISGADISDASYFGVAVQGPAAVATIVNSSIHDIGDDPRTGAQHGVGVFYTEGATGTVQGNTIWDYQKNGTAYTGQGTQVDSIENTVTGDGPTKRIAQNGIQYSSGASGDVEDNVVSDNIYTQTTSCTPQCVGSTTGVIATGILIFFAGQDYGTGEIASSNHAFRNQCNVCVIE